MFCLGCVLYNSLPQTPLQIPEGTTWEPVDRDIILLVVWGLSLCILGSGGAPPVPVTIGDNGNYVRVLFLLHRYYRVGGPPNNSLGLGGLG